MRAVHKAKLGCNASRRANATLLLDFDSWGVKGRLAASVECM